MRILRILFLWTVLVGSLLAAILTAADMTGRVVSTSDVLTLAVAIVVFCGSLTFLLRAGRSEKALEGRGEWSWSRFIFEISTVLVGVLLALGLNEWRGRVSQAHQLTMALDLIRIEIQDNRTILADRIPYWEMVRDTVHSVMRRRGDISIADIDIPGWKGTRNPAFGESAMQTAVSSGALANGGLKTVQRITKVYSFQRKYSQFSDFYFQAGVNGNVKTAQNLVNMMSDHAGAGVELLKAYDQLLEYLPKPEQSESVESD